MIVVDREAGGHREAAADRAAGALMRAATERQAPPRDVRVDRPVGVEVVRTLAEQLRVAVRGRDVEHDLGVLRDPDAADLGLDLGAPLHLRRRRPQPQRLLDDALREQPVRDDPIDDGGAVIAREDEIERVHQRLRAGVRAALQVRRDLADDAAVIELERRLAKVQEQHGEDVLGQLALRHVARAQAIDERVPPRT